MLCLYMYVCGCGYAILSTVIFLQYLQSVYVVSKIWFIILFYFIVLFYFYFFQLQFIWLQVHVNPLFYIFPSTCHWVFSSWHYSGCCLWISKALLSPKQHGSGEEWWRDNEEFVRHTGTYVVEFGVGIEKGGESCRRKKGKRIVEERRGWIREGSYTCRR